MFGWFKNKGGNGQSKLPSLSDLDQNPLQAGDEVNCLRYEMGRSKIILEETTYFYESLETGKRVPWYKMIDAITERQKVRKILEENL